MKKLIPLDIVTFITLCVVFYITYALLLQDNFLNISISSILIKAHALELKQHLFVLALLPVYIATVIFGSALFGIYLGKHLRHHFYNRQKRNCVIKK